MGSDVPNINSPRVQIVSIHAPTWGATFTLSINLISLIVSTHAPTWGATVTKHYWTPIQGFQPTLPHGERPYNKLKDLSSQVFQPTLPHGERHAHQSNNHLRGCFNPRSHMGSDGFIDSSEHDFLVSTHAPTWGATDNT